MSLFKKINSKTFPNSSKPIITSQIPFCSQITSFFIQITANEKEGFTAAFQEQTTSKEINNF